MTTAGPNSPGTAANDASVGTLTWASTSNVLTSNNSYTTVDTGAGGDATSKYLKVTNFGFAIPSGATILGITIGIESKHDINDGTGITTYRARVVKAGTIGSTNKTLTWSTTEAVQNLGGSSDLWGETWTAANINDSTTGFAIAVNVEDGGGATDVAYIDHITMTVTYSVVTITSEILRPIAGLESDVGNTTYQNVDDVVTQPTSPGDAAYASYGGTTTSITIEKLQVQQPSGGYTVIGATLWVLAHSLLAGVMRIQTIRIKLNGTWYDLGLVSSLLTTSPQWFSYTVTGMTESSDSDDIGFEWGIGDSLGTPSQAAKIDVAYLELQYLEIVPSVGGFFAWW